MRITGGVHRSRTLTAPRGASTRPTSDKVREALFSILASSASCPALGGARVLDLYAGTGALGLEALSRGAAHATLVERARDAIRAIRANVESLAVSASVRVVEGSVEQAPTLLRGDAPFDVVFADPPYADVETGAATRAIARALAPAVSSVAGGGLMAPHGCLVLEHSARPLERSSTREPRETRETRETPLIPGFTVDATRRYGDTAVTLYIPDSGR